MAFMLSGRVVYPIHLICFMMVMSDECALCQAVDIVCLRLGSKSLSIFSQYCRVETRK